MIVSISGFLCNFLRILCMTDFSVYLYFETYSMSHTKSFDRTVAYSLRLMFSNVQTYKYHIVIKLLQHKNCIVNKNILVKIVHSLISYTNSILNVLTSDLNTPVVLLVFHND